MWVAFVGTTTIVTTLGHKEEYEMSSKGPTGTITFGVHCVK